MVFSPRPGGVCDIPRRSHSIPRAFPSRSPEARTTMAVLYHKTRTTGDSHPVHDPVIGSLPQALPVHDPVIGSLPPACAVHDSVIASFLLARPGCLRAPHLRYLPFQTTGASADDPHINRLLPTNNRAGDHPCPGHRSETTQHRLFDGAAPKHSTSPRAKPISVGPPMHGLLWLWPFGHIVASSPSLPNLPFPVTHGRAM